MDVTPSKLSMQLLDSQFIFSKRMKNFFQYVGFSTIEELAAIPLTKFTCFRGFKTQCRQELIAFIEYEGIESLFAGYDIWKCQDNI